MWFVLFLLFMCIQNTPAHGASLAPAVPGTHQTDNLSEREVLALLRSQMQHGDYSNALVLLDRVARENTNTVVDADSEIAVRQRIAQDIKTQIDSTLSPSSPVNTQIQAMHRNKIRSQMANLERQSRISPQLARDLADILHDKTQPPSPISTLSDTYGGAAGMMAYHGVDGALKVKQDTNLARRLTKTTPSQVFKSQKSTPNPLVNIPLDTVGNVVRNGVFATYAALPFLNTDKISFLKKHGWENDPAQHTTLTKQLAGTHLVARALNLLFNKGATDLSAKEAQALAYHNRRHGVPTELQSFKNQSKQLAKMRLALRIIGFGLIPLMLKEKGSINGKTSRSLAAANIAGTLDSILGLYDSIKTRRTMRKLRKKLPEMQRELEATPPTEQERKADQFAASGMEDMSSDFDPSLLAGMHAI